MTHAMASNQLSFSKFKFKEINLIIRVGFLQRLPLWRDRLGDLLVHVDGQDPPVRDQDAVSWLSFKRSKYVHGNSI